MANAIVAKKPFVGQAVLLDFAFFPESVYLGGQIEPGDEIHRAILGGVVVGFTRKGRVRVRTNWLNTKFTVLPKDLTAWHGAYDDGSDRPEAGYLTEATAKQAEKVDALYKQFNATKAGDLREQRRKVWCSAQVSLDAMDRNDHAGVFV